MGRRNQISAWADDGLLAALDAKRQEVADEVGKIPNRSDIVRAALQTYLGLPVTAYSDDNAARVLAQRRRRAREEGDASGG